MSMVTSAAQVAPGAGEAAYDRVTRRLEWPIAILALGVVPALITPAQAPYRHILRMPEPQPPS